MDGVRQRADRVVNRTGRKPGQTPISPGQGQARRQEENIQSISPTTAKVICVSRIGGWGEEMRGTYETSGGFATLVVRTINGVLG